MQYYSVNRKRGRKGWKEKREPVGMPKDFDFHMRVIDVMFNLTYWVASTKQQLILNKLHSYEVGLTHFLAKLEDLSIHQIFNSFNPIYLK